MHRLKLSTRESARALGISRNTLQRYRKLLSKAGLVDGPLHELPSLEALAAAAPQRVPPQQTSSAAPPGERATKRVRDAAGPWPSSTGGRSRTATVSSSPPPL